MIFEHLRLRRRVSLLAAGVLEPHVEPAVRAHQLRCERCRAEHDELRALVEAAASDPLREAEPGLPLPVLVELVERRVERALASPGAVRAWRPPAGGGGPGTGGKNDFGARVVKQSVGSQLRTSCPVARATQLPPRTPDRHVPSARSMG